MAAVHYLVLVLIALAGIYILLGLRKNGKGSAPDAKTQAPVQKAVAQSPAKIRPLENAVTGSIRLECPGKKPLVRGDLEVETLWRLEHVLRGLQSPSGAVVQVDFRLDPRELALTLASNPMYAARILKTVNSAAFGLRSRIDSLQRAITFLGYNQVKNIVFQSMARDNLGMPGDSPRAFDQTRFWRHSHAVSVCAEHILHELGAERGRSGPITTAALLHDIGWSVFASYDRLAADALFARLQEGESGLDTMEAEQAAFGFNHALAGGMLAEQWHIPAGVCALISLHHCGSHGLPEGVQREIAFGACVIAEAESLAAQIGYGHPLTETVELRVDIVSVLGPRAINLTAGPRLKEELERTMKMIEEFSRAV